MTREWKTVRLGDVVTLKRGYDLSKANRIDGEVPIVSSGGITGWHNASKAQGPGVVTGRYGTLGEVYYIDGPYWPLNTALYVSDFKGNNPKFVADLLRSLNLETKSGAAAVPGVNRNHLHELPVNIPDLSTQNRIATVLTKYDELMVNIQRQVSILEEVVSLAYRKCFMQGVAGAWSQEPLGMLTTVLKRGVSPKYSDDASSIVVNQKCIRSGRVSLAAARHHATHVPKEKLLQAGDVVINSTGVGTLGRVAQVRAELIDTTVDSHVTILRPNQKVTPEYFGQALLAEQKRFESMGVGATGQTELSRNRLAEYQINVPPMDLQREYSCLVRPLVALAAKLDETYINLQAQRALIGPRLISGQVSLSARATAKS